ncbi:MAG: hypothetical protein DCC66_13400 [Planctomycetota bacterium]|nr:MAG: hypothetical protein DCC66_13400 [Planctomycetota bacterium]
MTAPATIPADLWRRAADGLIGKQPESDRPELIYMFGERAGIMEYDGGLPRVEAEKLAYRELLAYVETTARTWTMA